ncbi:kinase-like domain-containing protein [Kickxella alabastrina]|uniref:kinase-like domain-containing protein n=1 Tax=Kickxella alabastrina TaxID=61397 RepID=UPI00221F39DE|nr:kinase-like domain-containing protein [Kickxella alabastrina]KAI7830011.1 kinase-like domain-containing protein [Kickxella alabastrina]
MLENQLDGIHMDSDYEDMADNEDVEVPLDEDFVNSDSDCGSDDSGAEARDEGIRVCGSGSAMDNSADQESQPSKHCKVTINNFTVLKLIGKGGYGKVYLVQHKLTHKYYAMKVLRKASILLKRRQITFTMTERSILSEVQHPFIVKLYYAFQSNSKLYLIMEYVAGGELFTHMANERIFSEDQAVFYAAELVLALAHLHKLGIVFRDIKPENCLLDKHGHLVLTDFGLSKTALGKDGRTSTFCGTPSYMAPEVLELSTAYEFSVDWWSLGILLYEMLTGAVPFKGRAPAQISKNISKTKVKYPNYMTPDAKDLIIRLLRKNPAQRIGYGPKGIAELKSTVPVVASDCDVSNFATEFTAEELATSIVRGSLLDPDMDNVSDEAKQLDSTAGRDRYPAVAITDHIPTTACNIANANKNDAAKAGDDIDPATAFLGFSYVANSVLDTVR